MNKEFLEAMAKFVEEVKSEVSTYDDRGYKNPDLQEACENFEGIIETTLWNMSQEEPVWCIMFSKDDISPLCGLVFNEAQSIAEVLRSKDVANFAEVVHEEYAQRVQNDIATKNARELVKHERALKEK